MKPIQKVKGEKSSVVPALSVCSLRIPEGNLGSEEIDQEDNSPPSHPGVGHGFSAGCSPRMTAKYNPTSRYSRTVKPVNKLDLKFDIDSLYDY